MKSYLVDEISPSDIKKIEGFLKKTAIQSPLEHFYWYPLPTDLLNTIQSRHIECKPHVVPIELGKDHLKLELFIRSLEKINCPCQGYCTTEQRNDILTFIDSMLLELNIRT